MNYQERFKSMLIGTPLQPVLVGLMRRMHRPRHPGQFVGLEESYATESILKRTIKPNFNCVDIGAHLGTILADIVRLAPQGRHLAFEAVPSKAEMLKRKFPSCQVFSMALSDTAGTSGFTYVENQSACSGLAEGIASGRSASRIEVQTARLDDILPPDYRVQFVKVDVEGAELQVLKGARRTLERDRPYVFFECLKGSCELYDYEPVEIYDFLSDSCDLPVYRLRDWLAGSDPLKRDDFVAATESSDAATLAFNFLAAPIQVGGEPVARG